MGTYEQDGDPETEDPICWDVLDKDGNAVLLISHDVIAYQRFSDNLKCVIWEDSQIRSWLKKAFYEEAIDETEQVKIRETKMENTSTKEFDKQIETKKDVLANIFFYIFKNYLAVTTSDVPSTVADSVTSAKNSAGTYVRSLTISGAALSVSGIILPLTQLFSPIFRL